MLLWVGHTQLLKVSVIYTVGNKTRSLVLKVWSTDQQHQHPLELVRNTFLGPLPDLLKHKLWEQDPEISVLTCPPDDSVHSTVFKPLD